MFISEINPQNCFGENNWLISVAESIVENSRIRSAEVYIEGVLRQYMIFGHYHIEATEPNPLQEGCRGLISKITIQESYKGSKNIDPIRNSFSYAATPKQCNNLSILIKSAAEAIDKNDEKIRITSSCVAWVLDLLRELEILPTTLAIDQAR